MAFATYTLPDYQKTTLKNGLTVYLMEQHEVPLIDVNLVIKAGAIVDKKPGQAYLTAQNMALGTADQTKAQINDATDFIGATINASSGLESSYIESSFAKKDQQMMLTLIKDMITKPSFNDHEFAKFKKQHLLALEQAQESPKSVINQHFKQLVFGDSSYSTVTQGSVNSITALSLDDIKNFHQLWYQPQNAAIIVVGDFNSKKMLAQLNNIFSSWKTTQKSQPVEITQPLALTEPKVLLVDKADAIESTFIIGGLGISKNTPDRVGISVINTILGARFTSWLNDELRVNSGLTYGARSQFTQYSESGSFAISSFTKTETTIAAIDLALKTYSRLWQQGIDEKTLESAKAYVKGKFPPQFETSQDLSLLLGQMYTFGFNESYINTFEKQVNSLTLAKTKKLINQYFPQENLQMVIIGKASELNEQIQKYGAVKQVSINDAIEH